jgi:hypothetical protein
MATDLTVCVHLYRNAIANSVLKKESGSIVEEMSYVAAIGAVGAGVDGDALIAALEYRPAFIAADAGTTDAGAFALGTGATAFSREAVRRDVRAMLEAGLQAGIPVIIGSAGTAGADAQVDWVLDIVEGIAAELGRSLRGVAIYSEQAGAALEKDRRSGRIVPLANAGQLDADRLARCERVVAMMGVEPLQTALAGTPDFVVAGRCSDAALFAALPLLRGFPAGLAWHAGKVVECGTMACESLGKGVMLVTMRHDSFTVRPIGAGLRCTPQSVAAHSLYETADPFLFAEPSGTLDISASRYESEDDVAVRVSGSAFVAAEMASFKLEGAELAGYSTMIVGGVRDPLIIGQLDAWLGNIRDYINASIATVMGVEIDGERYRVDFQVYGRNAVMGTLEPRPAPAHEVGIVCSTLAPTQDEATQMARLCRQPLLHAPIPEWKGSITGFACLHNPAWVELGPLYRFSLNHILVGAQRDDVHRIKTIEIDGSPEQRDHLREVAL